MMVESGLHRYLGFYKEMPALLKRAGIDIDKLFYWEDEIIIRLKGGICGTFGLAPLFSPFRTLKSIFGNSHIFSSRQKLLILRFFVSGLWKTARQPTVMDGLTILEYAQQKRLPEDIVTKLLTPLSAGLFFLQPDKYSAFVFFGLFLPFLHRSYRNRVGAFNGGMTEVMAAPIGEYIQKLGGEIFLSSPVDELVIKDGQATGVIVAGRRYDADSVVLATSLAPAQRLLADLVPHYPSFSTMLKLQTMPSVTIQIELSQRCMPKDRTTFAPQTCLASFSEQAGSTFKASKGRLSIILTPPEQFVNLDKETILQRVTADLEAIDIHIRNTILDSRIVIEAEDFYALVPGAEALKPEQRTAVKGLVLAGDYTRQRYLATMEGAVYSGKQAAHIILDQDRNT
ncbi:FAD-dependent oxidoreductase [Dyadobacter sp. 676]|uniref:FAD-dependent oxidoreductase n=1 Tax=Dyadobacter sp. 676 TaxID=3088362 RepID=A0AAU8FFN3_9BACT